MEDILRDFMMLYDASPKITKMKEINSQDYRAFKSKEGRPVAITNVKKYLDYIPYYPPFMPFFQKYPNFWIIPCDKPNGDIYGYVLRSFHGKGFRIYRKEDTPQLLFGFHLFGDFRYGRPIILTEGVKDCLFLQQFYPYVLAVLTNSLSKAGYDIIKSLTNIVLTAFDNDRAGIKEARKAVKQFKERGVGVDNISISQYKDWGDYFDHREYDFDVKGLLMSIGLDIRSDKV